MRPTIAEALLASARQSKKHAIKCACGTSLETSDDKTAKDFLFWHSHHKKSTERL